LKTDDGTPPLDEVEDMDVVQEEVVA